MTILKHIPIHARTKISGMVGSPELVEMCHEGTKRKLSLGKGVENKKAVDNLSEKGILNLLRTNV